MGHKTLVKMDTITCGGQTINVRYYERRPYSGSKRYMAELLVGPSDRPTFDGSSLESMEARVAVTLPGIMESRELLRAS